MSTEFSDSFDQHFVLFYVSKLHRLDLNVGFVPPGYSIHFCPAQDPATVATVSRILVVN